jgi:hypothetical protein
MKRPSLHRVDLAGEALMRIPVNPDRVNAAFAKFLSTGLLPDDQWVASHIPARLRAHPLIERGTDTLDWQAMVRALVAGPPPAEDKVVDALLDEAIFGVGLVRMAARSALVGLVRAGFDLRQPIFDGVELPEFGTVGWAMLGFPQNFVAPHVGAASQSSWSARRRHAARPSALPGTTWARVGASSTSSMPTT